MNSLNKVLAKATELGMLQRLARRELVTSLSLYANDVVIFCHPDEAELRAVRGILELFGQASGLRTNFAKCSVFPIACNNEEADGAAEFMECQLAPFPIKYLGIPLSTTRLTTVSFQPLLDRLADKLPTWSASMMPRAGRLALIRAALAAIPLHQLMVLGLNKKRLKQVNKILRGFLWVGRAEANGGNNHMNWARVCRPLNLGGLRIPDLARMATSLRVRWLLRMRTDPPRPWRGLDMQFSKAELDIFAASTSMVVGNGESALFWEDLWMDGRSIKEMAPEVYELVPKRRRKARMVREALLDLCAAVGLAKRVLANGGTRHDDLVVDDGWCWTGEKLARRGLPHAPRCPLCDQSEETMPHLLPGCSFSRTIWFEVLSWIRSTSEPPSEGDFVEWWSLVVRTTPRQLLKGTSSIIMLTAWWIWKHRNAAIFDNAQPSVRSLFNDIRTEARQWVDAGARGVRQLLS
ncbi:uncharacterized protein [Lolium perenne]|uniref:uncharacterized protein n=1 Tax=Lolium perenne TaxID=4522 RepID=UPI0021F5B6B6|nr:uncharacterized protein LOC127336721 [Lolium perenne]